MDKIKLARKLIKEKPYLIWYSKNYDNFSEKSILESVLNYGNWDDFLELEKIYGTCDLKNIYSRILDSKRVNLRPQTINFFTKYFETYA